MGKKPRGTFLSRINKFVVGVVSRAELGNLFDKFKKVVLGSLGEQIDTLKIRNKKEVENDALSIFCPRCGKKYPFRECPLDLKSI